MLYEIREYYGRLNEIKANIATHPLPKPGVLSVIEMWERFKTPPIDGGMMDQPHLWLLEIEAAQAEMDLFEALQKTGA